MKKKLVWILVAALLLTLLLRLPSLFEPYSYADEGIYLVLGQAFRKGWVFYRDIHDNKPPLIYITAGLAGSLANFRLVLMVWNMINVWLVWLLAKKIFKAQFWPVLVSVFSFGLLSSLPFFEGNIANAELFMIMPLTLALYLILLGEEKQRARYFFLAGLAAASGFFYKVPIGFDLLGIGLWLIWSRKPSWLKHGLYLGLGFLLPNLLVAAYYFWVGAGERYLASALLQNLPYLLSWGGGGGKGLLATGLVQRGLLVGLLTGLIFLFKKRLNTWQGLLGLWFVWSWYGTLLSERPYPHYFIELVVVASLLLGQAWLKGAKNKLLLALALVLAAGSYSYYHFWHYPVKAYYANFVNWAIGKESWLEYQQYWGDLVLVDQQVAEVIKQKTSPDELIYVWGTAPGIYYLSNRLPVGRYTVSYHVADFNGFSETMAALKDAKPRLVVRLASEKLEFKEFDDWLKTNYQLEQQIDDRQIYLRILF